MGIYVDVISDRALTTTAKIQLSGDLSGNAASYTLPASCRGIIAVQPIVYQITPVANQTVTATMKMESDDLGVQAYEVFANPLQSNVATTDAAMNDPFVLNRYPVMQPTKGGEKVNFYGINQISATSALGVTLWWTDDQSNMRADRPYRAAVGGAAGGGASATSTGTSATSVTGATIALSGGKKRIRAAYGYVSNTTITASNPISGYFVMTAPELANTIRFQADPANGSLGTAQVANHLTKVDNLDVLCNTPTTIAANITLTQAPGTAGKFGNGLLFQDA